MTEPETARQEIAEYERWASKHPDATGTDASDLAAIGAARYQQGITHAHVAHLVRTARDHGRSWSEIGDRLGMTPTEAERSYGPEVTLNLSLLRSIYSSLLTGVANVLGAASHALSAAENMARQHSRQ